MPSVLEEGILQNPVIGTEYFLGADPKSAVVIAQVKVDFSNLQAGDVTELALYAAVRSTGTAALVERWAFIGPIGKPVFVTPSIMFTGPWRVSLKQVSGTSRDYEWAITVV
jgi:hypothetical protein